jgi:hypothetical protein
MQLSILLEPLPDQKGFLARMGEPFNLRVEATTAEEALKTLEVEFHKRLGKGTQLRALVVGLTPSAPSAGWLPDDELTREWLEAVEAHRKECDVADRQRIL